MVFSDATSNLHHAGFMFAHALCRDAITLDGHGSAAAIGGDMGQQWSMQKIRTL